MWIWTLYLASIACIATANDNLRVAYQWKQIDFEYPNVEERQAAINNETFIQENVIPVGIEVYKKRLFVTLPRIKKGVPASLAFIDLEDKPSQSQSPHLKPYPSWSAHQVTEDVPEIVSPYRVRADSCGHLWVLDTGVDGNGTNIAPTRILIYDLHNDNLLRSYAFPEDHVKVDSTFSSIAVEDDDCENIFAYCADMGKPGLVVYSWKLQRSWRMTHNFFNPEPTAGNFSIKDITFQWNYGINGIALSKPQADGHSNLYFHPFVSTDEFMVSTKFLKNETLATSTEIYHEFKKIGSRGPNGQSNSQFMDKKTGVLFYTLPNLNAVACWKTSTKDYNVKSQGRVLMSENLMEFPNDVKVDDQSRLWVISNKLQKFLYAELDPSENNFRIMTATVQEAVDHTACDPKTKPFPEVINVLHGYNKNTTKSTPPTAKSNAPMIILSTSTLISILISKIFIF